MTFEDEIHCLKEKLYEIIWNSVRICFINLNTLEWNRNVWYNLPNV